MTNNISHTILSEDERDGLLLPIQTIEALNSAELDAIVIARRKWFARKKKNWLTMQTMRSIHKDMFDDIWDWAGKFRLTNKNIGIEWHQISAQFQDLIDTVKFWLQNKTYSEKEIIARFHHQIVYIHPFPNGNGRFSRFVSDYLIFNEDLDIKMNWLYLDKGNHDQFREHYIKALRSADSGIIDPLLDVIIS